MDHSPEDYKQKQPSDSLQSKKDLPGLSLKEIEDIIMKAHRAFERAVPLSIRKLYQSALQKRFAKLEPKSITLADCKALYKTGNQYGIEHPFAAEACYHKVAELLLGMPKTKEIYELLAEIVCYFIVFYGMLNDAHSFLIAESLLSLSHFIQSEEKYRSQMVGHNQIGRLHMKNKNYAAAQKALDAGFVIYQEAKNQVVPEKLCSVGMQLAKFYYQMADQSPALLTKAHQLVTDNLSVASALTEEQVKELKKLNTIIIQRMTVPSLQILKLFDLEADFLKNLVKTADKTHSGDSVGAGAEPTQSGKKKKKKPKTKSKKPAQEEDLKAVDVEVQPILESATVAVDPMKLEFSAVQGQLHELEALYSQLTKDHEAQAKEIHELRLRHESESAALVKEYKKQIRESQHSLRSEIQKQKERIKILEESLGKKEDQRKSLADQLLTLKQENERIAAQLSTLQQEFRANKGTIRSLQAKIDGSGRQIGLLRSQLIGQMKTNETLQQEISAERKEKEKLQAGVAVLERQTTEQHREISVEREKNKKLHEEMQSLQKQLAEAREAKSRNPWLRKPMDWKESWVESSVVIDATPQVKKFLQDFSEFKPYVGGGAPRDIIHGEIPNDYDIRFAKKFTPPELEALQEKLRRYGAHNMSHHVSGLFTLVFGDIKFDIMISGDFEPDYTVNLLEFNLAGVLKFKPLADEKVIRLHSENKILHIVDVEKFFRDPITVIRGLRFYVKRGYTFSEETKKAIKEHIQLKPDFFTKNDKYPGAILCHRIQEQLKCFNGCNEERLLQGLQELGVCEALFRSSPEEIEAALLSGCSIGYFYNQKVLAQLQLGRVDESTLAPKAKSGTLFDSPLSGQPPKFVAASQPKEKSPQGGSSRLLVTPSPKGQGNSQEVSVAQALTYD